MRRKLVIPALLAVWMHSCAVYAQGARYVSLRPVRPDAVGGTLGDVDAQLPAGHAYRDADRVTWTHEATHGVNARVRIEQRAANGFYLRGERAFVCPHPPLTLREVAAAVPREHRGRVYGLYLVEASRHWNGSPLYVLDECTAYVNGSLAGLELGLKARSLYSFDNAIETWRYSRLAARLARERGYSHADALDAFLDDFHRRGIHYLLVEYRKRGWR